MQAGLPVVSTAIGGPAETVPQTELLCEPGNPKALAKSIRFAAEHTDRIAPENVETVHQKYHPDAVVPQFREAYERVVENSG